MTQGDRRRKMDHGLLDESLYLSHIYLKEKEAVSGCNKA